jgi:aspartyl-tRNA(Asn)/glutamyl-tRNA(Gln) amidotransferase subunit A
VIDVAGVPTRANCLARADLPPAAADATVVAHLRAAGAVIIGKTHTTELAYFESVPPTRNPHDLSRTPGGSSAGSAAAVASGTVPLALGTQTAGSVNRPASYCGVGAFKPSTLAIAGVGVVPLAPSFDTVGAFGGSAADAALLVAGYAADHLRFRAANAGDSRIAVLRDPLLDRAGAETKGALALLAKRLDAAGLPIEDLGSPVPLENVLREQRVVMLAELGRQHGQLPREQLAPRLAEAIETGLAITDAQYHHALRALGAMRARFWANFDAADIILLPSAPAVAPVGTATGDPSFVSPITALGGPAASVRAGLCAESGMPVGAMPATKPGTDARLAAFLWHEANPAMGL